MTSTERPNRATHAIPSERFVVVVREEIEARLAGHPGMHYTSPPQPRDAALSLIALLRHAPAEAENGRCEWSQPVAGGRRTIRLERVDATARP